VPSHAAGFVHPGTPVWLRVDAFPYERYGQLRAHVLEVSRSAVAAADLDGGDAPAAPAVPGAEAGDGGVFRVRVALDPPAGPDDATAAWRAGLRPGMRVQASLVAERRTLLQWALQPLQQLKVAAR
jgi:membrane fusion protein